MPTIAFGCSAFARAVAGVAYAAEKPGSARPGLEQIEITVTPNKGNTSGTLQMTATNGFQLARVTFPVTAFDPISFYAPAATLAKWAKAIPKRGMPNMVLRWTDDLSLIELAWAEGQVFAVDPRQSLPYPRVDNVIPIGRGSHFAKVYAGDLAATAASVEAILRETRVAEPARLEIAAGTISLTANYDGLRAHVTCRANTTDEPTQHGHTGIDPIKLGAACKTFDGLADHISIAWEKPEASAVVLRGAMPGGLAALAVVMPMTIKKVI